MVLIRAEFGNSNKYQIQIISVRNQKKAIFYEIAQVSNGNYPSVYFTMWSIINAKFEWNECTSFATESQTNEVQERVKTYWYIA